MRMPTLGRPGAMGAVTVRVAAAPPEVTESVAADNRLDQAALCQARHRADVEAEMAVSCSRRGIRRHGLGKVGLLRTRSGCPVDRTSLDSPPVHR